MTAPHEAPGPGETPGKPRTRDCCWPHHKAECEQAVFGWVGGIQGQRFTKCGCGMQFGTDAECKPTPAREPFDRIRSAKPAVGYMALYLHLRDIARECGYALAVHGSMQKDLDLIAVPWTKEAVGPDDLVKAFMGGTDVEFGGGFYRSSQRREEPYRKDHGRLCYTLIVEDTPGAFIDLSVMPRITTVEVVK